MIGISAILLATGAAALLRNVFKTPQQSIINTAKKWIGFKEIRGNQGFQNADFEALMIKFGGFVKGQPWCGYFVTMVLMTSLKGKQKSDVQNVYRKLGDTNNILSLLPQSDSFVLADDPKTGDIVVWNYYQNGEKQWNGHTGIVINVTDNGFDTIEGNTNTDGSSEGYEVVQHHRDFIYEAQNGLVISGYVRLI